MHSLSESSMLSNKIGVKMVTKALGMIETKGLATSIEATDAILKAAAVRLVSKEKATSSLVTILVEGDVSAVQTAIDVGKKIAKKTGALIACSVIPHPEEETGRLFINTRRIE